MKKHFFVLLALFIFNNISSTDIKKEQETKSKFNEKDIFKIKVPTFKKIEIFGEMSDGKIVKINTKGLEQHFDKPVNLPKLFQSIYLRINNQGTGFFKTEPGYLYTISKLKIDPIELTAQCPKGAILSPSQTMCIKKTSF